MQIKSYCLLSFWVFLFSFVSQRGTAQDKVLASDSTSHSTTTKSDTIVAKPDSTKKNAIDAPIQYTAKDSMVMVMEGGNMVYLYGEGAVKYKNLDLTGEYIEINADSSIIYATYGLDSIGEEFGYPIFKEGEQQYEMKKARYNFRTKKMFINDVITQQGEGYVTASRTKKMPNDDLFMSDGKYSTCDEHDHPHFYFQMTKAKLRPGKTVVTGPAYLVIEDVPLPIAIPFGFFPFTKDYSSGIIMPTYGDEMARGFSLRNGGYYFAFSDYIDLALTGEIYTKGSWGVDARSTYKKRYKYSGNFDAGYLVTITGDKGAGDNPGDYKKSTDIKLNWSHSQDPKANPFSTFSANVNFTTSTYDRNSVTSLYSDQQYQNTKSSSVNYNYRMPNSPLSISANMTVNQQSRDTMVNLTLPNLTITLSDIYPFRRKEQVGDARWYEAIRLSYTGLLMNSVSAKEYDLLKTNLVKDWRNGMKHEIPISASFNLLKYISINPSFNYTSRWYTSEVTKGYDVVTDNIVPVDTAYGFYRVYNYSAGISANTKLYGMYAPWSLLGKWTKGVQIRHVLTPSVSFNGAPDFGNPRYGYYRNLVYDRYGKRHTVTYSPFDTPYTLWGAPGQGKTGAMSFSLDNNLEMKVPVGADSTRKVSLIDNLRLGMSYNFLADSMKWSDINASIRLKFGKSFTLSLQGVFDTYTYNSEGDKIDVNRWEAGKGFGRLMATGTSFSYSLNNETIKKLLGKGKKEEGNDSSTEASSSEEGDSDVSDSEDKAPDPKAPLRGRKKKNDGEFDSDGYLLMNIPWNLSFNYSLNLGYNKEMIDNKYTHFNPETREFDYKITQTLGVSGNISPSKGWNFTFTTSYDFDYKQFAAMQCTVTRNMHCWQMSASVIPIGPYQSYNFSIAVSSSLLKDLKYNQSSNYRDAMNWY